MDDEEEFKPSPTEGSMTMGAFVRKIVRWVGGWVMRGWVDEWVGGPVVGWVARVGG